MFIWIQLPVWKHDSILLCFEVVVDSERDYDIMVRVQCTYAEELKP